MMAKEIEHSGPSIIGGDNLQIDSVVGEGVAIGNNARVEIKRYGDILVHIDSLEELPPKAGDPPFKGLNYFSEADAGIFFGREELSEHLAATLDTTHFLAVVGASGSGKTSLLHAGIAPRLRKQNWLIHIITPTSDPLGQLANSLARDEPGLSTADSLREQLIEHPQTLRRAAEKLIAKQNARRLILIVDQFEELFTQCHSEKERRIFLDQLLNVALGDGNVSLLIGLRADFTGHLAEPPALREMVQENFILLGPMQQEDLVRVIMEPARVGGWAFVDGLVEQILEDVGQEPGRLPLLSHALLETWERRAAHVMTLKGYREAGGVEGAIAKTAEDTLRLLKDREKQRIMQSIFLGLTELGEGSEDTRRKANRAELERTGDKEAVDNVLETLVLARLVTINGDNVEVAHEALIRRWPRLREWLADNRERLRFERQLEQDAQEWADLDQDPGALYRGARLAQALEWQAGDKNLSPLAAEFLTASQIEAEEEAKQVRQLERAGFVRRVAYVIGGLAVLAVFAALAAGFLGYRANQTADELSIETTRAVSAEAEAVVAKATSEFNEELARQEEERARAAEVVAVAAQATSQFNETLARDEETRAREAEAVAIAAEAEAESERLESERLRRLIRGAQLSAESDLSLDHDPELALLLAQAAAMASYPQDGELGLGVRGSLYSALSSPYRTTLYGHSDAISSAAFSPNGEKLVTGSRDGKARLWDIDSGKEQAVLDNGSDPITWALFSPDGRRVFTSFIEDGPTRRNTPRTDWARLWDSDSGELIAVLRGHTTPISTAAFSPDGRFLATTSGCSSEGQILILNLDCTNAEVKIWGTESGQEVITIGESFENPIDGVNFLTFNHDGTQLIAVDDNMVLMWNVENTQSIKSLSNGLEQTWLAVPDLEGQNVFVVGCEDQPEILESCQRGSIRLIDVETGQLTQLLANDAPAISSALLLADGRHVITSAEDGSFQLWDAGFQEAVHVFEGFNSAVRSAVLNSDGSRLLAADNDGLVHLLDVETGEILDSFEESSDRVISLSFSSSGPRVVTADRAGMLRLWEIDSGQLDAVLDGWPNNLIEAAFTPEGPLALVHVEDGSLQLWDVQTGQEVRRFSEMADRFWGEFLAGGRKVEVHSCEEDESSTCIQGSDHLWLWDVETGDEIPIIADNNAASIKSVVFGPEGEQLLTLDNDEGIWQWNLQDGNKIPFQEPAATSFIISPDGKNLATRVEMTNVQLWDIEQRTLLHVLEGFDERFSSIMFSPDSRKILTIGCNDDGWIGSTCSAFAVLWDVSTGEELATFDSPTPISSAAFSRSGDQLVTAGGCLRIFSGDDCRSPAVAWLWDAGTGEPIAVFEGHVDSVSVSPNSMSADGIRLVTSSRDDTLRVWETAAGELLTTLEGFDSNVRTAEFGPKGDWMLTTHNDSVARLWRVLPFATVEEMLTEANRRLNRDFTVAECRRYFSEFPEECNRGT